MNTFAAAHSIGTRPRAQRKRRSRLDEEAQIFLVSEGVVAVMALVLGGIGWFIAANYHAAWALWQARMMGLVAAWAVYLVLRAWATRDLRSPDGSTHDYGFGSGD